MLWNECDKYNFAMIDRDENRMIKTASNSLTIIQTNKIFRPKNTGTNDLKWERNKEKRRKQTFE